MKFAFALMAAAGYAMEVENWSRGPALHGNHGRAHGDLKGYGAVAAFQAGKEYKGEPLEKKTNVSRGYTVTYDSEAPKHQKVSGFSYDSRDKDGAKRPYAGGFDGRHGVRHSLKGHADRGYGNFGGYNGAVRNYNGDFGFGGGYGNRGHGGAYGSKGGRGAGGFGGFGYGNGYSDAYGNYGGAYGGRGGLGGYGNRGGYGGYGNGYGNRGGYNGASGFGRGYGGLGGYGGYGNRGGYGGYGNRGGYGGYNRKW